MKSVEINNEFLKEVLKEAEWFARKEVCDSVQLTCQDADIEHFTSDKYRDEVVNAGMSHNGFPEAMRGYSFSGERIRYINENQPTEISNRAAEICTKIQTHFCLKGNALFTVYPPGGFISWHNNANASAYNFIFTWSENGNGLWKHIENGETITIPDVPGWQCKAGFFGAYEDSPDKLCYHMARTDCWRMTISFILDRSDMAQGIQDWVIEDIESAE